MCDNEDIPTPEEFDSMLKSIHIRIRIIILNVT